MTDVVNHMALALRWQRHGLTDEAREYLSSHLTPEVLADSRTMAIRYAALVTDILGPDPADFPTVPDGIDGYAIHGRACDCGQVDCQLRGVHQVYQRYRAGLR